MAPPDFKAERPPPSGLRGVGAECWSAGELHRLWKCFFTSKSHNLANVFHAQGQIWSNNGNKTKAFFFLEKKRKIKRNKTRQSRWRFSCWYDFTVRACPPCKILPHVYHILQCSYKNSNAAFLLINAYLHGRVTGDNHVLDCKTQNCQCSWKTIWQSRPGGEQKRLLLRDWALHVNRRRKLITLESIFPWRESAKQVDLPRRASVTGVVIDISASAVRAEIKMSQIVLKEFSKNNRWLWPAPHFRGERRTGLG